MAKYTDQGGRLILEEFRLVNGTFYIAPINNRDIDWRTGVVIWVEPFAGAMAASVKVSATAERLPNDNPQYDEIISGSSDAGDTAHTGVGVDFVAVRVPFDHLKVETMVGAAVRILSNTGGFVLVDSDGDIQ